MDIRTGKQDFSHYSGSFSLDDLAFVHGLALAVLEKRYTSEGVFIADAGVLWQAVYDHPDYQALDKRLKRKISGFNPAGRTTEGSKLRHWYETFSSEEQDEALKDKFYDIFQWLFYHQEDIPEGHKFDVECFFNKVRGAYVEALDNKKGVVAAREAVERVVEECSDDVSKSDFVPAHIKSFFNLMYLTKHFERYLKRYLLEDDFEVVCKKPLTESYIKSRGRPRRAQLKPPA